MAEPYRHPSTQRTGGRRPARMHCVGSCDETSGADFGAVIEAYIRHTPYSEGGHSCGSIVDSTRRCPADVLRNQSICARRLRSAVSTRAIADWSRPTSDNGSPHSSRVDQVP